MELAKQKTQLIKRTKRISELRELIKPVNQQYYPTNRTSESTETAKQQI